MNFLTLKAVMTKTSLGRTTLYNLMADGRFPKSIKVSARKVAWDEKEVEDWMQERLQERDGRLATQSPQIRSVA